MSNLLKDKKFQEGNQETVKLLEKIFDRNLSAFLVERGNKYSVSSGTTANSQVLIGKINICKDVQTIDRIWHYHSKGNFGFATQLDVLKNSSDSREAFGIKSGWRVAGEWIGNANYTETALRGHLPSLIGFPDSFFFIKYLAPCISNSGELNK